MATIKKYNGSTWENAVVRKYGTATETIQSGDTIYANGQPITTYTLKGNEEHTGTPSPQNPVMPNGTGNKTANLFNKQAVTNNERVVYTDGTTAPLTGVDVSDYIPLETGETYTLNISSSIVSKTGHLYAMYDSSKNFVNTGQHPSTGAIIYSFTVPNGVSFIRFNSLMTELDNVMLVKGSYTTQTFPSYEPYGYKIPISSGQQTIDIYIGDLPLLKSLDGTAVDEISNGTLTRRVDSDGSVLPTPTTTQITMPSIPTTEGANSITVDTTVQPSEFTATWTGWHNANVKEWDGSQWQ